MALGDFRETAFNYIAGEKTGTFYTGEQKWVNKIKSYANEKPNLVKIKYENDDGSIVAEIPINWFRLSPPRKVSDEQKEAASQRFKQMWAEKNSKE